jgi:hypothetical protein
VERKRRVRTFKGKILVKTVINHWVAKKSNGKSIHLKWACNRGKFLVVRLGSVGKAFPAHNIQPGRIFQFKTSSQYGFSSKYKIFNIQIVRAFQYKIFSQ